jgi:hypothetical protein
MSDDEMAKKYNFTKGQTNPVLTPEGKAWCQNCIYCNEQINFIKDPSGNKWIRVGKFIRHRKCLPPPAK